MKIDLTKEDFELADFIAGLRWGIHKDTPSRKTFNKDSEKTGLLGEIAVGKLINQKPHHHNSQKGDGGYDYIFNGKKIEVKTATSDYGLLIRIEATLGADYYVYVVKSGDIAYLMGYVTKQDIIDAPVKESTYRRGIMNRVVDRKKLKPVKEILPV